MDSRLRIGGLTFSVGWLIFVGRELFISRPPGESLAMLWEIISPTSLYLMLGVFGVASLAYFGWPVLGCVFPRIRLLSHVNFFAAITRDMERDDSYKGYVDSEGKKRGVLMPSKKADLHHAIYVLDSLQVPHPPFGADATTWGIFLSRLLAGARTGRLDYVRNIWPDMEAEQASHRRTGDDPRRPDA